MRPNLVVHGLWAKVSPAGSSKDNPIRGVLQPFAQAVWISDITLHNLNVLGSRIGIVTKKCVLRIVVRATNDCPERMKGQFGVLSNLVPVIFLKP